LEGVVWLQPASNTANNQGRTMLSHEYQYAGFLLLRLLLLLCGALDTVQPDLYDCCASHQGDALRCPWCRPHPQSFCTTKLSMAGVWFGAKKKT
jgi:hypothetical protein